MTSGNELMTVGGLERRAPTSPGGRRHDHGQQLPRDQRSNHRNVQARAGPATVCGSVREAACALGVSVNTYQKARRTVCQQTPAADSEKLAQFVSA